MTKGEANTILVGKPRSQEAGSRMKAGKKALGRLGLLSGPPWSSFGGRQRSSWWSHTAFILPQQPYALHTFTHTPPLISTLLLLHPSFPPSCPPHPSLPPSVYLSIYLLHHSSPFQHSSITPASFPLFLYPQIINLSPHSFTSPFIYSPVCPPIHLFIHLSIHPNYPYTNVSI